MFLITAKYVDVSVQFIYAVPAHSKHAAFAAKSNKMNETVKKGPSRSSSDLLSRPALRTVYATTCSLITTLCKILYSILN